MGSAKTHAVWLIPLVNWEDVARNNRHGSFDAAVRIGEVSLVKSQTMDAARLRLVKKFHSLVTACLRSCRLCFYTSSYMQL